MNRREFLTAASAACVGLHPLVQGCGHLANSREAKLPPPESHDPTVGLRSRHRISEFDHIPTVELHRHFEAGLTPEMIALLARRNKITQVLTRNGKQPIEGIDLQDPASVKAYYERIAAGFKQPDGIARFLDSLGVPVGVMKSLDDLEEVAYRQILDQAAEGSIHTELRGSPYTYQEQLTEKASLEEVIRAIRRGIQRAYRERGASGGYTACFSRNKADKYGQAVVTAVTNIHTPDEPVGIDIAGAPEDKFPPTMFEKLLKPANEAGVPITVHAGEQAKAPDFKEAPPQFVRDAVEKLGAKRIGHGTSLIADPSLWPLLQERGIGIECCPVSNDKFGYMLLNQHPLWRFLTAELRATVNTDDPLPFGVASVRDMVRQCGAELTITPEALIQMTRNGIATAFVTEERRKKLEEKLRLALSR